MRSASRQVDSVPGLEFEFARGRISEFDLEHAAEDPEALVFFVAVPRVDRTRHIVPAETLVPFLMQARLGLDFGSRQVAFFSDDPDSLGKVHVISAARSGRVAEGFDRGFALAPELAGEFADLIEVFEKFGLPALAAFEGLVFEALGVEVELRDGSRKAVGLEDGQVFFAIEVERVVGLRVVHKCLKGYPILREKKRTPAKGSSSGRGRSLDLRELSRGSRWW